MKYPFFLLEDNFSWVLHFCIAWEQMKWPRKAERVWCNKKTYLAFILGSWCRASKTLGITWVIGASFVLHSEPFPTWAYATEMTLGGHLHSFRMGTGCQKTMWLEGWNFQLHFWPLGRGDGWRLSSIANGQWSNQLFLHNGTSIKTSKQ